MITTSSEWDSLKNVPGNTLVLARLYYGDETSYISLSSDDIILDGEKNINGKSQKNSCMKKPFTVPGFCPSQQYFFAALCSGLLFLIRGISVKAL